MATQMVKWHLTISMKSYFLNDKKASNNTMKAGITLFNIPIADQKKSQVLKLCHFRTSQVDKPVFVSLIQAHWYYSILRFQLVIKISAIIERLWYRLHYMSEPSIQKNRVGL